MPDNGVEEAFGSIHDIFNLSIWLGLHKKKINENDCVAIAAMESDAKFTDYTLDKCYSVNCVNITEKQVLTGCLELQHPLCVKNSKGSYACTSNTSSQFSKI